jgi:hypothetical protein
MLLVSWRSSSIRDGGTTNLPQELDISNTTQVRLFEGKIYALRIGGELYRDNELVVVLPDDAIDFCLHGSDVYVLRPDGLYLGGNRVMALPSNTGSQPNNVLLTSDEDPEVYILLSDGSCFQRRLYCTGLASGNAESSLENEAHR